MLVGHCNIQVKFEYQGHGKISLFLADTFKPIDLIFGMVVDHHTHLDQV